MSTNSSLEEVGGLDDYIYLAKLSRLQSSWQDFLSSCFLHPFSFDLGFFPFVPVFVSIAFTFLGIVVNIVPMGASELITIVAG